MSAADLSKIWDLPHVFEYEGQKIRYNIRGEGPPLVLVHGTPFSSVVWRKIIPHLEDRYRVYYYDLLGYGQSEMRDGQIVSLGVQNEIFAALLEHWGLGSPDVVGHDFGGATVLRGHLLNKRNYRSLTLIDPVALSPWGTPLPRYARQHESIFAGLPDFIQRAVVPAYIEGAVFTPLSAEAMALYAEPWFGPLGQPAFWRQIAQFDEKYTDEIESKYDSFRCPVMILWGKEDKWISVDFAYKLAEKIAGSKLKIIPNAGHIVQEDAPEAIIAELLKFLPNP
ncbi:alpha/beta hydrolase [Rhizobium lentis]|uniref:Alpha/beta hydrolase n=1 Tax=Rhizobium lentis TaxID=1138194 RepID=A0A9Q3MFH6_9HYPH|nr:alpha/beta hydrolase [Rhizobium lentis]MBX4958252.1 alpha/beta hydrolase [Rhizobium lentis]MBX4976422.1 alpha/beta hydrolase [Rhizobium lentis]MBX4988256.1 alpha/beta hydrolase [Rhizobium lentis]MBX4998866.1 alpha/beta hydrolase [Rhizobium lentis]MBX5006705.1 alpha/beta hydrolase [Rhizobium lentis]